MNDVSRSRRSGFKAFTLIELLVVIAIIAIHIQPHHRADHEWLKERTGPQVGG